MASCSLRSIDEHILPAYKKITSFWRRNGVDIILMDSDGDIDPIIPNYLKAGFNCFTPLEAACVDLVALRKKYGKRVALIGGIDKRALVKGKEAIEREVESKVPYLKREGGYIPCIDHLVSPDIPYEN